MTDSVELNTNIKDIQQVLTNLSKSCKSLKPLMRRINHIIETDIDDNFETEGQNAGKRWSGWSDNWKIARTKMGRGQGKILQLEGELRESITSEAGDSYGIVGTDKEYAAIHNFGGEVRKRGSNGKFNMEARTFMLWTGNLKKKIIEEIKNYINENSIPI